ncbi:uncharacterized protein LOC117529544 isoform X1 [Thalassophryne amazonica]|uniref:uncharacterized protein LOC117529544 isoform X1 n=1 Tax=Thalassophryne amazonica TaxID=390379 RepID=UPI001471038D|nr:uncharacterized protein LOC117529544 isoform X1 [Thalassophryne amazonica]
MFVCDCPPGFTGPTCDINSKCLSLKKTLTRVTETSTHGAAVLAEGHRPSALLLLTASDYWLDLHGANDQKEAPVRGSLQPQCSGAGRRSPGDGQNAQSSTGGTAHLRAG